MRTIKFRTWDTQLNMMLYPNQFKFAFIADDKLIFSRTDGDTTDKTFSYPEKGRYIFLEYTGILDSKGIEIFEGDILLNRAVNFFFGCFGLEGYSKTLRELAAINSLEVQGNIYENPGLLK